MTKLKQLISEIYKDPVCISQAVVFKHSWSLHSRQDAGVLKRTKSIRKTHKE